MPLNKKLRIDATKKILLEGTTGIGGDDTRKHRASEEPPKQMVEAVCELHK
jgi:hypothetical protein